MILGVRDLEFLRGMRDRFSVVRYRDGWHSVANTVRCYIDLVKGRLVLVMWS